ncbi:MAG TPA: tetratricopeptide repeat protein [Vicinamibacteria bacterium]|nr:tetratricopeptide repeat protein [Vicinamibacteria bacterium]
MSLAAIVLALLSFPAAPAPAAPCGPTPYDCAVSHVTKREFTAAIAVLEGLLGVAPRDLKALNLLGIALTAAGRAEEGSRRFREALAIDPAFHPARKNVAVNAFAGGRLAEAQRQFEAVLEHAPDDEIAHVHLGEIHFQGRRFEAALAHYEKSAARVAANPTWTLHHASALLERGQGARAVAVLEKLPESDAASRFEAGVALGRAGRRADAARFFGSARHGHADPYSAAYNQALMLIEAGEHAAAARVAEELFAAGAQPAELHNLAARAYLGLGRVQQAYDALRAATRLDPEAEDNYLDLATIALDHHNYDLGLEILDVGLLRRPASWRLHLHKGVLQAMKARLGDAETDFEAARRLAPEEPAPLAALAMAWMQSGQAEKAVAVLRDEARRGRGHMVPYMLALALMRAGVDPAAPEASEAVTALRASLGARADFAPARAELGRLLLKQGDVDGAVRELERAVALDPESSAALYNLAQAYMKKGDRARAAEMAARVSRLNAQERGDDADGEMRRMVVRLVREGSAPSARAASEAGPRPADGGGADAQVAAARAHLERARRAGSAAEAVSEYEMALYLEPDLVEAADGLSGVCASLGDLDGAVRLLARVVEKRPSDPEARYNLGLNLWNRYRAAAGPPPRSDLEQAARELAEAERLAPGQARIHATLGQVLAEQQSLAAAAASLQRAVELAPGDATHAYDLGLVLRRRGDLDAAEARLRAAIALDPAHGHARRALGLVLRQKDDLDGALAELRRSVELLPGDAQGHNVLGTVLLRRGHVAAAIDAFGQAVRLDPSLTEARVNRAQALVRAGRRDEARSEAQEVERLKAAEAGVGRAMILMETASAELAGGRAGAAVSRLREATAASPSLTEAHYRLGLALGRAGADPREAQAPFLRTLELDPGHARARYETARILAALGETDSAVLQLRRALGVRPSLVDARRELARLAAKSGDWAAAVAELQAALAWEPADAATRAALAAALSQSKTTVLLP